MSNMEIRDIFKKGAGRGKQLKYLLRKDESKEKVLAPPAHVGPRSFLNSKVEVSLYF